MAMSVFTILGLIVLAIAAAAVFRRIEARTSRLARMDHLATRVLEGKSDGANRQDLADLLRGWEELTVSRQQELQAHLSGHPRLEGVDVTDADARRSAYESLVGISPGKSPEK